MANMAPPPAQNANLGFASAPANAFKLATPDRYISLGAFINEVNKPDNRTQLVKTFGNQGITGFLQLVGAVKTAGTADEVQWWEEQRLHPTVNFTTSGTVAVSGKVMTVNITSLDSRSPVRVNDIVLWNRQQRAIVTAISATGITLANLANAELVAATATTTYALPIIGNLYGQGTDQPTQFLESNVVKRTNPYMIMKEIFKVTGSQATNIGWVDVGGGDYRWFIKGESDTRQRFIDKREMMMLLGQKNENPDNTTFTSGTISGSEGYFSAIENRGLVTDGYINTLVDIDTIITALDRNGAGPEYALYVDRFQDLALDDIIAKGVGGTSTTIGVAAQFGAFNNSPNMAIELGFKSFGRGGYTFHKHDWKLLNDPTLLGVPATASGTSNTGNGFAGVMIPMATVVDPKTGNREFPLEINYKSTNGVSREMQHWLTGSFMGASNSTRDELQFNYLSEIALVTRAANRHVLIKRD
jgi:hypothetical protein